MRNVRALCSLAGRRGGIRMWWIEAGRGSKAPTEPTTQEPASADGGRRSDATSAGAEPGMTEGMQPGQTRRKRGPDKRACSAAGRGADPAELERSDDGNHLLHAGTGAACESDGLVGDAGRVDGRGIIGRRIAGRRIADMSSGSALGRAPDRCMTTAKAANVSPTALTTVIRARSRRCESRRHQALAEGASLRRRQQRARFLRQRCCGLEGSALGASDALGCLAQPSRRCAHAVARPEPQGGWSWRRRRDGEPDGRSDPRTHRAQ
jgi:hypothetical protein